MTNASSWSRTRATSNERSTGTAGSPPTNVVELGVYQGGSAVFWNLTLRPARHLALDRSPLRIAPLDAFVEGDRHHGDLRLALGVDQSDVAAVTAMVDDMFGDEGSIW